MSLTFFMHPSVPEGDKENQKNVQTAPKASNTCTAWYAAECEPGGSRKTNANDFIVGGIRPTELQKDHNLSVKIPAQHRSAGKETAQHRDLQRSCSAPQTGFQWNTKAAEFVIAEQTHRMTARRCRPHARIAAGTYDLTTISCHMDSLSKQERRIFVGGLPSSCRRVDLRAYFQKFGKVSSCHINFDKNNKSRRFGFVTFSTIEEKDAALAHSLHFICDRWVQVHFCIPPGNVELDIRKEIMSKAKGKLEEAMLDTDAHAQAVRDIEIECAWQTREQARRTMRQRSEQPNAGSPEFSGGSIAEYVLENDTDAPMSGSEKSLEMAPRNLRKSGFITSSTELPGSRRSRVDIEMAIARCDKMRHVTSSTECGGNGVGARDDILFGSPAQENARNERGVEAYSAKNEMRPSGRAQNSTGKYIFAETSSSKDKIPTDDFWWYNPWETHVGDAESGKNDMSIGECCWYNASDMPSCDHEWYDLGYDNMMYAASAKFEKLRVGFEEVIVDEMNTKKSVVENTQLSPGEVVQGIAAKEFVSDFELSAKCDKACSEYTSSTARDRTMADAACAQSDMRHGHDAASTRIPIDPDEFPQYAASKNDMAYASSAQNEMSCGAVGCTITATHSPAYPKLGRIEKPDGACHREAVANTAIGPPSSSNTILRDRCVREVAIDTKGWCGIDEQQYGPSVMPHWGNTMVDAEMERNRMPWSAMEQNTITNTSLLTRELLNNEAPSDAFMWNTASASFGAGAETTKKCMRRDALTGDIDEEEKEFRARMIAFNVVHRSTQRRPTRNPRRRPSRSWAKNEPDAQGEAPSYQAATEAFASTWRSRTRPFISEKDNIWAVNNEKQTSGDGEPHKSSVVQFQFLLRGNSLAWNMPSDRRCTVQSNTSPSQRILNARARMFADQKGKLGINLLPGYEKDKEVPMFKRCQFKGEYQWNGERFIVVKAPEDVRPVAELVKDIAKIMRIGGECDIRDNSVVRTSFRVGTMNGVTDKNDDGTNTTALGSTTLDSTDSYGVRHGISEQNSRQRLLRAFDDDCSASKLTTHTAPLAGPWAGVEHENKPMIREGGLGWERMETDLRVRFLHPDGALRLDDSARIKRRRSFSR